MSDFRYYRPSNFPPVVKNLVIINAIVYVAQLALQKQFQLTNKLMLYPVLPHRLNQILDSQNVLGNDPHFMPYQIFTHMFAHDPTNFFHLLFNMLILWMFGRVLENVWGPKKFLFFYLACGVGAAVLHLGVQYLRAEQVLHAYFAGDGATASRIMGTLGPALGASGAIMGIMAAFAYLFPNTELYIMFLPIPIKAKWVVLGYVAYDLIGGIASADNIAHFAHLGGAITGFIIIFIWNKTNRKTFY
jgi:rhomboid family protein